MKRNVILLCSLAWAMISFGQTPLYRIVTTDIDNFWKAYDKIKTTTDSTEQHQYFKTLYLDPGTEGLSSLMQLRRYTPGEYVNAINKYPDFWNSIRENTFKSKALDREIGIDLDKIRQIYPAAKPVTLYFSIGCFRTNGTILGDKILIGSEMALADESVKIAELPEMLHYFYSTFHPLRDVALLCAHEYVHTQQQPLVDNLLSSALYEGVAEFVSTKVTGKASYTPAIAFGKNNEEKIKQKFIEDLFLSDRFYHWLWGANRNELKERDLGYYVGYAICERNYEKARDKSKAIQEMIDLDYADEKEIEEFVDRSGFLGKSVKKINRDYEKSRPRVIGISQFKNGSKNVDPKLTQITLHFSQPMDKNSRGFDYGPLGENHVLRVKNVVGFSEDGKSFTFEVELKPGQHYQSVATNQFRLPNGVRLKPYLIDIQTAE